MVFITFPTNLTEEEEILLKKYAKLRKKLQKKESQSQKTGKSEPQKPPTEALKRSATDAGAEDAKEQAKKLLKSGAIKLDGDPREKKSFKRSKNYEKNLKEPVDKASLTFQPFSSQFEDDEDDGSRSRSFEKGEGDGRGMRRDRPYREPPPKRGNTVFIRAQGITEEIVRRLLSQHGNIINCSMELDKNCAFVTFESTDSSDQAIKHLHDSRFPDVFSPLEVSIARRQPTFEPASEQPMGSSWSSIAASASTHNRTLKEQRETISYDDDIF